jgi:hypothetical protein
LTASMADVIFGFAGSGELCRFGPPGPDFGPLKIEIHYGSRRLQNHLIVYGLRRYPPTPKRFLAKRTTCLPQRMGEPTAAW